MSIIRVKLFHSIRFFKIKLIEDTEPAWFPDAELKEVHGIAPHEPTELERTLFCFNADGSEGLCWRSKHHRTMKTTQNDENDD